MLCAELDQESKQMKSLHCRSLHSGEQGGEKKIRYRSKTRLLEGDHHSAGVGWFSAFFYQATMPTSSPGSSETNYQGPCVKAFVLGTPLHGALVSYISVLLLVWVNFRLKCHLSEATF